jgi:hypothetical protein
MLILFFFLIKLNKNAYYFYNEYNPKKEIEIINKGISIELKSRNFLIQKEDGKDMTIKNESENNKRIDYLIYKKYVIDILLNKDIIFDIKKKYIDINIDKNESKYNIKIEEGGLYNDWSFLF